MGQRSIVLLGVLICAGICDARAAGRTASEIVNEIAKLPRNTAGLCHKFANSERINCGRVEDVAFRDGRLTVRSVATLGADLKPYARVVLEVALRDVADEFEVFTPETDPALAKLNGYGLVLNCDGRKACVRASQLVIGAGDQKSGEGAPPSYAMKSIYSPAVTSKADAEKLRGLYVELLRTCRSPGELCR